MDFCTIVGNLLDNAIEGVGRIKPAPASPSIRLAFSRSWDMFYIYCENPCDTWVIIQKNLKPYEMKLRGRARNLQTLLGEISAAISEEEFQQKRNLDGTFCLGFDSQRYEIIEEAKRIKKENDEKKMKKLEEEEK